MISVLQGNACSRATDTESFDIGSCARMICVTRSTVFLKVADALGPAPKALSAACGVFHEETPPQSDSKLVVAEQMLRTPRNLQQGGARATA